MTSVSVVVCKDEATAQFEAGKLSGPGVDVKVREVNKTSGHTSKNTTVDTTNKLAGPVWLVTAIEE